MKNPSERIGGLFMLLGAASLPFIIIEYVMITSGAPTMDALSARMAYYEANIVALSRGWHFEVLAMALIGAGALTRIGSRAGAGWALAAIGVAATLPMYPAMIGGYPSVFDGLEGAEVTYRSVNGFTTEVFYAGNLLVCFGLAIAFWLESGATQSVAPGWVLWVGTVANLAAGLGFLGLHFGLALPLTILGPVGLLGFLSTAAFGAYLAFGKVAAET